MKAELFGFTKNKEPIQRYSISGGGLNAMFINWGAVLQDLRFENDSHSMVLGLFCSGPMLALCLAREDAVSGWRDMLGPTEVKQAKEEHPNWYTPHTIQ